MLGHYKVLIKCCT